MYSGLIACWVASLEACYDGEEWRKFERECE
jgi:hypothetical protein